MNHSRIGVVAIVTLTCASAEATPTVVTTVQPAAVARPVLLARPVLTKTMTMKQAVAASTPLSLPLPPPPPTPHTPQSTAVSLTTKCAGGGTAAVTYSAWSSTDATTGLASFTATIKFNGCKSGTASYDGSLTLSQSASSTTTTLATGTTVSAAVSYAYDGGPLTITGDKPMTVTFQRYTVTLRIDASTVAALHVSATRNGTVTIDGQTSTFHSDSYSVDGLTP